MTTLQTIALVTTICAAGAWVTWLVKTAPEGYETDEGFFYGREPLEDPRNWGDQ